MITQEYTSPSKLKFTLREQTGEDDDRLSAAQSETSLINTYIASVIIKGPKGNPMSVEDVKKLRLGDKYFLVLASRILSLGETLYFEYQWPGDNTSTEYSEDLTNYIWDYEKEFPEKGSPYYFDQRIPPYPEKEFIEGEIKGFKLRMDYLDGYGEDYLMKLSPSGRTVNQELKARNLRVWDQTDWKPVATFAGFTARDMHYIRNLAHSNDPPILGLTRVSHPLSEQTMEIPLLGIKDFFYPAKI